MNIPTLCQIAPGDLFVGEPHPQLFDLVAERQQGRGFGSLDRQCDGETIRVCAMLIGELLEPSFTSG